MNFSSALRRSPAIKCINRFQSGTVHFPASPSYQYENLSLNSMINTPIESLTRNSCRWSLLKQNINLFQASSINKLRGIFSSFSSSENELSILHSDAIWLSSTVKKRRMKMNKHKLKKRKKDLRMNTKVSRQ
jgi:hypothetical protein